MRINQFVAQATGLSRRAADQAIKDGRVSINGQLAKLGDPVKDSTQVTLDTTSLELSPLVTIMLNKPAGYVVSRDGQGSQTIYDLLQSKYHNLKPVGRLDKDSSGLLVLTNDGELANELTHPSYSKNKVYEVELDKPLEEEHQQSIREGVELEDGVSRLEIQPLGSLKNWQVTMSEGRNRQIRRTFAALDYKVTKLHRTRFGSYKLGALSEGTSVIIHK